MKPYPVTAAVLSPACQSARRAQRAPGLSLFQKIKSGGIWSGTKFIWTNSNTIHIPRHESGYLAGDGLGSEPLGSPEDKCAGSQGRLYSWPQLLLFLVPPLPLSSLAGPVLRRCYCLKGAVIGNRWRGTRTGPSAVISQYFDYLIFFLSNLKTSVWQPPI